MIPKLLVVKTLPRNSSWKFYERKAAIYTLFESYTEPSSLLSAVHHEFVFGMRAPQQDEFLIISPRREHPRTQLIHERLIIVKVRYKPTDTHNENVIKSAYTVEGELLATEAHINKYTIGADTSQ